MLDLFNRKKLRDLEDRIKAIESNESFTPHQIEQLTKDLLDSNYLLLVTSQHILGNTEIIIPPDKKGIVLLGNDNRIQGCRIRFARYKIIVEEP